MLLGQEPSVNTVSVWDRGSRWDKKKKVSSPSWSPPGTGPSLLLGQPWSRTLVRGEETSLKSTYLHQQNTLLWTVQPNSLLMCHFARTEHHADKWVQDKMGKEWGSTVIPLLCKHPFPFSMKHLTCPDQAYPSALSVGHTPVSWQPCTASQQFCQMLQLCQVTVWTTTTF